MIDGGLCIAAHESGGGNQSAIDAHAVGSLGEVGVYQLLPRNGLLPAFYERGYLDPFSATQQANWLADEFADWQGGWWGFWFPWLSARKACL